MKIIPFSPSYTIDKEGRFYKECSLVMLDTTNVDNSLKGYLDESILFNYQKEYKTIAEEKGFTGHFHIYIKSDDEIIATTDKLLIGPQPSDEFIQAYIEAYNKGEKIEKVLVEYSEYEIPGKPMGRKRYTLKLKDNNIIIKKVKDSWTRKELPIDILQRIISFGDASPDLMKTSFVELYDKAKRWVEDNL